MPVNALATVSLNAGDTLSVALTDVANGYVIADAMQLISTSAPPNAVTWQADLSHPAEYEVYALWSAHANRASNASYVINHVGGEATVTANQQQSGGVWNSLGTYQLDVNYSVSISDVANGYVIADAIQLRQVANTAEVPSELHYIHGDHLGVARVITNEAGDVSWAADRLPFGQTNVTTENISYNLRFPGQYYDGESGLHYNYYRDYDPGLGRYVQSDPIGLQGGLNTYAYAYDNPVNYSDFYGLDASLYPKNPLTADPSDTTDGFVPDPGKNIGEAIRDVVDGTSSIRGPFGPWCGTGWNASFTPDWVMSNACKQHDACYSTCGKTQGECDLEFLRASRGPQGPLYYAVVARLGKPAYDQAQKEAKCDEICAP